MSGRPRFKNVDALRRLTANQANHLDVGRKNKEMKLNIGLLSLIALLATCFCGCDGTRQNSEIVAEGILFSVEYQLEGGKTGGFTRLNLSQAVPGGNGSWNVDAYGQLTQQFLIITRPQREDLGPQVIPAHRLVNVQFGDGGIDRVNEGAPKSN